MLTMDDYVIRGFNCIHLTSRDIGGRACGGMSVLARVGIPYSEYTQHYTTLQAKAVTISTSKVITICSLYLPPSEYLNIVLLTRLIEQLPTPFVVCGDFNDHSITWGCDKNSSSSFHQTSVFHLFTHFFAVSLNLLRSSNEQGCARRVHCIMCAVFSVARPHSQVVSPS